MGLAETGKQCVFYPDEFLAEKRNDGSSKAGTRGYIYTYKACIYIYEVMLAKDKKGEPATRRTMTTTTTTSRGIPKSSTSYIVT